MNSLKKRDMIKYSLFLQSQQTRRDAAPHDTDKLLNSATGCWGR